ncbi:MAG: PKD domain-containing protein [Methanomassiliicoccales archaeon]|nr:PKD domain-containing protein [Methanomassiliicoccales archaeon]
MEGEGERLPREGAPKGSMTKIIAAVIVIIIVVAAIAGAVLLMGGKVVENKSPTVSATADATTIIAGESVTFDASDSTDPDGEIVQYIWNFGDGATDNVAGAVVTHTYAFPGKYLVTVTVVDDKGGRTTNWNAPIRVEVLHPTVEEVTNETQPYVVVASSDDIVESGTKVDFDANSSAAYAVIWDEDAEEWIAAMDSGLIASVVWSFGDGNVLAGNFEDLAIVNHTYVGNGSVYASWLAVTSIRGAAQMYYMTIIVLPEEVTVPVAIKNPDTYIVATIGEPQSLDPAYDYETAGGEILQNVYETLVWYDYTSGSADKLIPMLATNVPTIENGGVSQDGLNYTFHIRQGVKFHDGTTMNAYDVEYSLERVLRINDPSGPAWMMGQVMIPDYGPGTLDPDAINASVEVVDEYTIVIHLIQPYPAFIKIMAYTVASIVSMEYFEEHLESDTALLDKDACGTGPFKLKEWVSNQYIMLERFDDYWREPAKLKYVIIKKVQDVNTREMMLFSGDADSVYIPRQHTSDVRGKPGLRIVEGLPTFNIDFIGFNQNIQPGLDIGTIPATFFSDINIRKAFVHAFDYETFIESTLFGTGIQARGAIPKDMFGYNESVPLFEYNLTKAAYYLTQAIDPTTNKSWAEKGFEIVLYYNAGNTVREAACGLLKKGLESLSGREIGGITIGTIKVKVEQLDWSGEYLPRLFDRQLPIFVLGWAPDYADPDDYTFPFYHENGTYAYFAGINNHTLTLKVEEAAKEFNETRRAELYYEIEMAVYENAYYLWLAQATNFHVERDWTQGYYYNPMFAGLYYYPIYKA